MITAAWLLLLRSHLLLPARDPRQPEAERQAAGLRDRLLALDQARALAGWLEARAQLGQAMFARGWPDLNAVTRVAAFVVDRVKFLWGCVALFEGDWSQPPLDEIATLTIRPLALHRIDEAEARVRERLASCADPVPLSEMLPQDAEPPSAPEDTVFEGKSDPKPTLSALTQNSQADVAQEIAGRRISSAATGREASSSDRSFAPIG